MTTGPFEPDGSDDDEPRRDRDGESIPQARGESAPHSDDDTHFIGRAHVGAAAGAASAGGAPPPPYAGGPDDFPDISEEEVSGLGGGGGVPVSPRRVLPLEDEPSALVARYLFPTERYRGEWRKHWIHLINHILVGAVATLALGYLTGFLAKQDMPSLSVIAVVVYALVMGWVAWSVADWYYDRFILTNKRVMVVRGLITRNVAMMPLLRVTDMKYEQSPLGRMLNYGTFVLESAGQDQALREVKHLPNPNELYLRVVEEMYEPAAVEARLGREAEDEG
ncbi:membrane protein YdbS with pleckstrin-like domain [Hamadaea flava]|uniref:PH domain-containing protein n=1 Tax=Hamadaea flava TaxID=1742688 RepID=A0ABV8LIF4_9ACTN|nr:PH domain-containing protein [Hamadaea flava]MCP2325573.1 membrane protein YdbS with pleckstrin-like domain [Hamadaea flava]